MRYRMFCWLCFAFVLTGCYQYRDPANPGEIAGEYVFSYETGEVEVMVMREDMTYQQAFYRTVAAYRQHDRPAYVNGGRWSYKGSKITWEDWLQFRELSENRPRSVPMRYGSYDGIWVSPCRGNDALLDLDYERSYFLRRDWQRWH